MLCPEVWNFSNPQINSSVRENVNKEELHKIISLNDFYKTIFVTIPDENTVPTHILEALLSGKDYYSLVGCPATAFLEPEFIEKFIKQGTFRCLSIGGTCLTNNCMAISNGVLILHVNRFDFQTLGVEGQKRPHDFYEIKIDLIKKLSSKLKSCLSKLQLFDLHLTWDPPDGHICRSSVAKYFFDENISVSVHYPVRKDMGGRDVSRIPSIGDPASTAEWIGMVWHDCDLTPDHEYVSSYSEPRTNNDIESSRIAITRAEGWFTSDGVWDVCEMVAEYVQGRTGTGYWAAVTCAPPSDSPNPSHFQSHQSSTTIFLSNDGNVVYSCALLKYTSC